LIIEVTTTEPYQDFLFAMNSPVTRERYSTRLRSFFVHIGIEGTTMNERCRGFIEKMKENEKNAKIVRRWDVLQRIPEKSANDVQRSDSS
jgi:hypothetical protein